MLNRTQLLLPGKSSITVDTTFSSQSWGRVVLKSGFSCLVNVSGTHQVTLLMLLESLYDNRNRSYEPIKTIHENFLCPHYNKIHRKVSSPYLISFNLKSGVFFHVQLLASSTLLWSWQNLLYITLCHYVSHMLYQNYLFVRTEIFPMLFTWHILETYI
jgi:hypothetical protein